MLAKQRHHGLAVLLMSAQEDHIDWPRVEDHWRQVKGKVKEQWRKLTDDDLDVINGRLNQLDGRLQQRCGYAKVQAAKDINDWYGRQKR